MDETSANAFWSSTSWSLYTNSSFESYQRGDEKEMDVDTLQLVMGLTPEEVTILTSSFPASKTRLSKKHILRNTNIKN